MSMFGIARDDNRDDKPHWDYDNLTQELNKINKVLHKPFVDLTKLPGLFCDNHDSLKKLAEELAMASVRIKHNYVSLRQPQKAADYIDLIRSRIFEMDYQIGRHLNNKINTDEPIQTNNSVPLPTTSAELTLPVELWVSVFLKLGSKDRSNLKLVNTNFQSISTTFFNPSFMSLYQHGYYSNSQVTLKDVCDAFNFASDKNTFLFFKLTNTNNPKFRTEFRHYLEKAVQNNTGNKMALQIAKT